MPATLNAPVPPTALLPTELVNGDRLTQKEFHELYKRMPKHVRAELIGGIVYMASPLRARHGNSHCWLTTAFVYYEGHTPGVQSYDNATVQLDGDNEPQPDLFLRILPAFGGATTDTEDGYISGAPELVCEVSDSTRSLDLNATKREYAKAGVLEYLVLNLRDNRLHWFDLKANQELTADPDGIIRVRVFPGLWIDPAAVLARDLRALLATLDKGLASPEHAAFVAKLAAGKSS